MGGGGDDEQQPPQKQQPQVGQKFKDMKTGYEYTWNGKKFERTA